MHRGNGWRTLTRGGVALMRIDGALTRDAVDATRRAQLEALAARPAGMAFLLDVSSDDVVLPSADVRAYAAEMAAKHAAGMQVHVTLLPGSGFRAAALRSALTGIFFLARSPYPRVIVASEEDALTRIERHLGADAPPLSSVREALVALRAS